VADLTRKTARGPHNWAYCSEHLFGGRIVNGIVEIEVRSDSPAAEQGFMQ
jgi:hypothetical protein